MKFLRSSAMRCPIAGLLPLLLYTLCGLTSGWAQSRISGRVLDKATGHPVPFVSVALYRQPDSVATCGSVSDSLGYFVIPNVKAGAYKLNTFFIGYKLVSIPLAIGWGDSPDLGTLFLESDPKLLREVRVQGQRADLTVQTDRQRYRAAQFQSNRVPLHPGGAVVSKRPGI